MFLTFIVALLVVATVSADATSDDATRVAFVNPIKQGGSFLMMATDGLGEPLNVRSRSPLPDSGTDTRVF